jgi:hypothetical protein
MKKFEIIFFLSLCTMLAGGYNLLSAYASNERTLPLPTRSLGLPKHTSVKTEQSSLPFLRSASSEAKRHFLSMDATEAREQEEDEHESISFRKNVKSSYYLAVVLYDRARPGFFNGSKISSVDHYSLYSSSYRYLVFQVFRI